VWAGAHHGSPRDTHAWASVAISIRQAGQRGPRAAHPGWMWVGLVAPTWSCLFFLRLFYFFLFTVFFFLFKFSFFGFLFNFLKMFRSEIFHLNFEIRSIFFKKNQILIFIQI
jgi:hypothetical protein